MQMKKLIKAAVVLAAAAFLAGTGTYGYFSDTLKVKNHISTGDVNIGLKEYEKKGSTEVSFTGPKAVVPGDVISKIPRITNYASPCWVRARITYKNDRENVEGFDDKNISGISKKWVRRGEYYYYTGILKQKDSVDLFKEVTVPETWTEEHTGQELGIIVQAEAIQAANFNPDFKAMSPWGNQEIQLCVHEENGKTVCRKEKTKLSVEFNGQAHKLMSVPGDFFVNLGTAMPGDEFQDTVTVSNTTDQDAEIFFRTAVEGQNHSQTELLKGVKLTVDMDDMRLYEGTLDSPGLNKNHSLGKFSPDEKGKLKFSLSIPSEWDNSYALRDAEVQWIFTVNETPEKENGSGKSQSADHKKAQKTSSVKTGDFSKPEALFTLLLSSGTVILTVFICRKGGRRK